MLAFLVLLSCHTGVETPDPATITDLIARGNFEEAEKKILLYTSTSSMTAEERLHWSWETERIHRISLDFNKTEEEALEYIRQYFPKVTPQQMSDWETSRA